MAVGTPQDGDTDGDLTDSSGSLGTSTLNLKLGVLQEHHPDGCWSDPFEENAQRPEFIDRDVKYVVIQLIAQWLVQAQFAGDSVRTAEMFFDELIYFFDTEIALYILEQGLGQEPGEFLRELLMDRFREKVEGFDFGEFLRESSRDVTVQRWFNTLKTQVVLHQQGFQTIDPDGTPESL